MDVSDHMNKSRVVALHACCGPCLIEPFAALESEGAVPVIVYANPNIAPAEEYARRLDTLRAYADSIGAKVVEIEYDPDLWATAVAGAATRAQRCRACYRVRLDLVARYAVDNGIDAIATTLSVSPYQDADAIRDEAREAAAAAGIDYVGDDYRERFPAATQRSRELGMYRQNYCGCLPSREEAQADREARKATRRASRST
jgi:predicted adenine nucleotide alpha hydrolase (AANH) superfamily ATPase